jgi:glucosamine--fructose-6-phosphate aminotransferase (isomerizing)
MCGIIGYLGSDIFLSYIISGLKLIQNRGYDSVGISTINNSSLNTIKFASTNTHDSLDKLEKETINFNWESTIGIGHTRWATHGGKTDINAHPHHDNLDRIALVHNGIIENYAELKKSLIEKGYKFKSATDTEVIAVQIGYWLDHGLLMQEAIKETIKMLTGTWALSIIHIDYPNKMWITRNGSPLLLGIQDNFVIVASEQIAFGNYINKYIVLDNHDIIEIELVNSTIKYNKDINSYDIKNKLDQDIQLSPAPYKYWMQKEIMEQADSVNRALNNGGRIESNTTVKLGGLDSNKNRLLDLNHLILLGCGTSYNAGLWSLNIYKSLDIFETVTIYDGAEFNINDIPKKGKTGLILLSQSGETKDLHRCLEIAKSYDLITIGVVNVVDSMIARESSCGVYLNAGREVGVASTKSFTSQTVVLTLIAIWFSQERGTCLEKRRKIISDLRNLSWQIEKVLEKWQLVKDLVPLIDKTKSCFILGKGSSEAIAKESALKLKEISYIHAEGFSSSALKHGPFALITNNLPIFILDVDIEHTDKNSNAYAEVKAREAHVIKIGSLNLFEGQKCKTSLNLFEGNASRMPDDKQSDNSCDLQIDYNKTFGGLLANVYLQILSFEIALNTGNNPDYPRNLAKVVTVE